MKLWYSSTSAYVRKVRAVASYHGLDQHITLAAAKSFDSASPHNLDNPLGRIPALQLDNGKWLYGSSLIAEYLDSIGQSETLYPHNTMRWDILNLYALTDGLLENTTSLLLPEKMLRPQNEWWLARHNQMNERNRQTLHAIAAELPKWQNALNIGTLNAVCAIEFLLFRDKLIESGDVIRDLALDKWIDEMNIQYPCLANTKPVLAA